jgi:hypothetical protein
MCFEDSSSSRHLSQMGSSVSPNLERCPFRWQCPVSSTTTHLNWSLLSLNRSFVLLAEGIHAPLVLPTFFLSRSVPITNLPRLYSQKPTQSNQDHFWCYTIKSPPLWGSISVFYFTSLHFTFITTLVQSFCGRDVNIDMALEAVRGKSSSQ